MAIAALAALACAHAHGENWQPVKGRALRALFPGKELGDGVHFAYRFAADGTYSGTEMGTDVQGRWRIRRNQACLATTQPKAEEDCYEVERDGAEIRMLKYGSEAWSGRLSPAE